MNEIEIDTAIMREKGQDIIELVGELRMVINEMFERIKKIPTSSLEWISDSALKFVALAEYDKKQYLEYANVMYKYGEYLKNCADSIDKQINDIRRDV